MPIKIGVAFYVLRVTTQEGVATRFHCALVSQDSDLETTSPFDVYQVVDDNSGAWKTLYRKGVILSHSNIPYAGCIILNRSVSLEAKDLHDYLVEYGVNKEGTMERMGLGNEPFTCAWWVMGVVFSLLESGMLELEVEQPPSLSPRPLLYWFSIKASKLFDERQKLVAEGKNRDNDPVSGL